MNDSNNAVTQMGKLTTANTKSIAILGARAMVLGTFFDVVLPHLNTSQRAQVTHSFRQGIEDVMSLMDDIALPGEYHSALLGLTNEIVAALSKDE